MPNDATDECKLFVNPMAVAVKRALNPAHPYGLRMPYEPNPKTYNAIHALIAADIEEQIGEARKQLEELS